MKKILLALAATVVFGKLIPLLLTALLIVGGVVILVTAMEEGKQL